MGEHVKAFVAFREVAADPEIAAELIECCRSRLAHNKSPREVQFVDDLPRLDSGKMLKRKLLDRVPGSPVDAQ